MAGVREIKGRIRSVKNIQQITKAMKMVAAARIKKVENRMKAARPYANKMREVVTQLAGQLEDVSHPLLTRREVTRRVGVVVVTADKGLCGSYNNNVLKVAFAHVKSLPAAPLLVTVGGKGHRFFTKRKADIAREMNGWMPEFSTARELAALVTDLFVSGQVDEIHCVTTQVKSALSQEAVVQKILPLASSESSGSPQGMIYEPGPEESLGIILPRYLDTIFFQILLEARTAELGARLRAMSNATDNANKLVGDLTLEFFRARQSAITNEILEVASGAEALHK